MREDLLRLIYGAIDEVSALSTDNRPLQKTPDAHLLGGNHGVDSLTFINLVVAIEEQIQSKFGKSVVLVDEDSMARQEHPFRTIGTLAVYIEHIVTDQQST